MKKGRTNILIIICIAFFIMLVEAVLVTLFLVGSIESMPMPLLLGMVISPVVSVGYVFFYIVFRRKR